jgi:site-specific recombinase XerD
MHLEIIPTAAPQPLAIPSSQQDIFRQWLASLKAKAKAGIISDRTATAYASNGNAWLDFIGCQDIERPGPADVVAWVGELHEAGQKPSTVNAKLAAVKAFYGWAETAQLYPAIARSVKGPRVQKDEPLECLDTAGVAALLELVDGEALASLRDRALLHVLYSTACRLVSLHSINVADLDQETGEMAYKGKGDASKARKAYLGSGALDAVLAYLEAREKAEGELAPDAPLFAAVGNKAGGARLSTRSMRRVVVGLMERAGHISRDTEGKIRRPRVFSAHSLRRSSITAAADAVGLEAAQTLAGHADARTTRRAYARVQKGRTLRELAGVLDLSKATTAAA